MSCNILFRWHRVALQDAEFVFKLRLAGGFPTGIIKAHVAPARGMHIGIEHFSNPETTLDDPVFAGFPAFITHNRFHLAIRIRHFQTSDHKRLPVKILGGDSRPRPPASVDHLNAQTVLAVEQLFRHIVNVVIGIDPNITVARTQIAVTDPLTVEVGAIVTEATDIQTGFHHLRCIKFFPEQIARPDLLIQLLRFSVLILLDILRIDSILVTDHFHGFADIRNRNFCPQFRGFV